MHFAVSWVALLGASGVLAASNVHKRAAKYERKHWDHLPRANPTLIKRQSTGSYLTNATARKHGIHIP